MIAGFPLTIGILLAFAVGVALISWHKVVWSRMRDLMPVVLGSPGRFVADNSGRNPLVPVPYLALLMAGLATVNWASQDPGGFHDAIQGLQQNLGLSIPGLVLYATGLIGLAMGTRVLRVVPSGFRGPRGRSFYFVPPVLAVVGALLTAFATIVETVT
jgi:uncharacterized membrane protein (UPF0136 family)